MVDMWTFIFLKPIRLITTMWTLYILTLCYRSCYWYTEKDFLFLSGSRIPKRIFSSFQGPIFGFGYYDIISPDNLNIPFLPYRESGPKIDQLLFPIGNWKGWYFSEEIKCAISLGYKCHLITGGFKIKLRSNTEVLKRGGGSLRVPP